MMPDRLLDFGGRYRPELTWVLAAMPRTGSNLVRVALQDTGRAGVPLEYFDPLTVTRLSRRWGIGSPTLRERAAAPYRALRDRRWPLRYLRWRPGFMRRYAAQVLHHRTGPPGVFGTTLFFPQIETCLAGQGFDIIEFLDHSRVVYLVREDRLARAVSEVRALQTLQWRSTSGPPRRQPRYDAAQILQALERYDRASEGWERLLLARRIEPLRITYEQLTGDHGGTLRQVIDFLDLPVREVPRPRVERQADELNARWQDRFLEEHPELLGSALVGSVSATSPPTQERANR